MRLVSFCDAPEIERETGIAVVEVRISGGHVGGLRRMPDDKNWTLSPRLAYRLGLCDRPIDGCLHSRYDGGSSLTDLKDRVHHLAQSSKKQDMMEKQARELGFQRETVEQPYEPTKVPQGMIDKNEVALELMGIAAGIEKIRRVIENGELL